MALAPAGSRYFIGDANATYQMLDLVADGSIAGMSIMSLPHEVRYSGSIDVNYEVVVTAPVGGSVSDCRVFYGTKDAMVERSVTSVEWGGAMSAPTQTINFIVDSVAKQIQLPAAAGTDIISSHTYFCHG